MFEPSIHCSLIVIKVTRALGLAGYEHSVALQTNVGQSDSCTMSWSHPDQPLISIHNALLSKDTGIANVSVTPQD